MNRVDSLGNVAGRFSDGNPQLGQIATRLNAKWHNAVQEELMNVILAAGLVPDDADLTQLLSAIIQIVAGAVGTGGASVPTTRTVTGAGLLAGQGGALATNLVFGLFASSIADAIAQIRNDVVITPASLAGFISVVAVGGSAVIRLGPVMMQMQPGFVPPNTTTNIILPTSFPTACIGAFCNGGESAAAAQDNNPFASGWGQSNVLVYNTVNTSMAVNVLAIGY